MKNGLRIIDSDMHIMEPLDLWDRHMEVRFKERAPRPVRVPTRGRNDAPLLTMKPSEYFMRQCVIGFAGDERDIGSVAQLSVMTIWFFPPTILTATRTFLRRRKNFSARKCRRIAAERFCEITA